MEAQFSAKIAMFAQPGNRIDRFSYPIPTAEAIRGAIRNIYWKPSFSIVVKRVRVMNPISRTTIMSNGPKDGRNESSIQFVQTYLENVSYQVEWDFVWNHLAEDARPIRREKNVKDGRLPFVNDMDRKKHISIFNESIKIGGRKSPYLGTSECLVDVTPCKFGEGVGAFDNTGCIDWGLMFHGWNWKDEPTTYKTSKKRPSRRWWNAKMIDGVIQFPNQFENDPQIIISD